MLKWLISYTEGTLTATNASALQTITADPSYRGHQIFIQPGGPVKKTQNCFTWAGCVLLCNRDESAMNAICDRCVDQLCYFF